MNPEKAILRRAPDRRIPTEPGTWAAIYDTRGDFGTVAIACPQCGAGSALEHEILADGTVKPSVVHPCGYHEFVTLEGWDLGHREKR